MTTLQSIQQIFQAMFDLAPEAVGPEAVLEDLGIDSLSMIEVLFAVEDEFKIVIPHDPVALRGEMKTVGDLADYVDKLVAARRSAMASTEMPA